MKTKREGLSTRWVILILVSMLAVPVVSAEADSADSADSAATDAAAAAKRRFGLMRPELATERAPEKFRVRFDTTEGDVLVEVTRAWAPIGADRFYNLVKLEYYHDGIAFHRVIKRGMAQFGIHGDPEISRFWRADKIEPDPVVESNKRGYLAYATKSGSETRSTQIFINLVDNEYLDRQGFAPFGKVVEGMDIVDAIYVTGEPGKNGTKRAPNLRAFAFRGNGYLKTKFPNISYITGATFVELKGAAAKPASPPAAD